MANVFDDVPAIGGAVLAGPGNDPVPGVPSAFKDVLPVDEAPPPERSYMGASAKALGQASVGMAAGAAQGLVQGPLGAWGVPNKKDLLYLYRNDPAGFDQTWNSPFYYLQRKEEEYFNKATETMSQLSERGKTVADRSYNPFSGKDSAYFSPEKVGGDLLQSGVQSVITGAGVFAATRGNPEGMLTAGAAEGLAEGQQTRQQVRQDLEAMAPAEWSSVKPYQDLVKQGWHPEMAKRYIIEDISKRAGTDTAILSGLTATLGEGFLSKLAHTGQPLTRRLITGGVTELPVESIQSGLQQVEQNLASREIDKTTSPWKDVPEQMWAGGAIGTIQGGAFNGAIGRRRAAAAQSVMVTDALGASPDIVAKTPLPPMAAAISDAAKAGGVDPNIAMAVAHVESGFNPQAVNGIGATGLFQFLGPAMQTYGVTQAQLLADPDLQITTGIRMLADASKAVSRATGQEAKPGEIYMAQLFGHGGVQAILKAPDEARLLDVVKGYGGTQDVLTANNIPLDISVGEAKERYAKIMGAAMGRGLDASNGATAVNPSLDQYRSRAARMLDENDVGMLADKHLKVDAAEAEKAALARDTHENDNSVTLDKVREPSAPIAVAGAAPATRQLTRAAVDAINEWDTGARPAGRAPADLLATAAANGVNLTSGSSISDVIEALREAAKQPSATAAQAAVPGSTQALLQQLDTPADPFSLHDTGMSEDRLATRRDTANPNHSMKRENRPVQAGPATEVGKPLREVTLRPGEVVTAGLPYEGASLDYMKATHDLVQKFIGSFAPTARVVLTHESRGDALATQRNLGGGWYQINPTNVTRRENLGRKFNTTTELQAAYSLAHEVGHVIVDHEFFRGLSDVQVAGIESLPATGYFEESFIQSLPRDQQSILREYNKVKAELIDNPKAGAKEFIQRWLSPWKIAHGFDQANVPAEGWARYAENRVMPGSSRFTAAKFAQALEIKHPNILGVHEYLAEQFSRYAYKKSLVEQTALGQSGWFAQTLEQLRAFFKASKLDRLVAPMQSFEKWLQTLPDTAPQPAKNAKRLGVPLDSLASDRQGKTRFDDSDEIALRDSIALDSTLGQGPVALPPGQEFYTRQEGANTEVGIGAIQSSGSMQRSYALEFDPQGKVTFANQVTKTHAGLGPTLVEYAHREAMSRGLALQGVPAEWQSKSTISEAARREALDLIAHGQPETAKELIERSIGKPSITRWDGSLPGMDEADTMLKQWDKIPSIRGAVRTSLATGHRKLIELKHYMSDIRQVAAANPDVMGLRYISQSLTNLEAYRGTLETQSMEIQQRWGKLQALNKVQAGRLSAFMEQEHTVGKHVAPLQLSSVDGMLSHVPDKGFAEAAQKAGLNEQTAGLFLDIKNNYLTRMKLLQKWMREQMLARRDESPDRSAYWNGRMQQLAQSFDTIMATPFHPQTRFGQHVMEVREGKAAQPFHVETFESAELRENAVAKIRQWAAANKRDLRITETFHDSHTAVMRVLPREVLDQVGLGQTLTMKQRRDLFSSLDTITRGVQIRKYSPTLGAITGASKDHLRVFSDFMHNDALVLSKLMFRQDFMDGLSAVKDLAFQASLGKDSAAVAKHESLYRFASKAVKQILNPAAEYHAARSFVVMHDLWASVKTAVVNLTDMVNTWAGVTKTSGTFRGTAIVGSAAARVAIDRMGVLMDKVLKAPTEGWSRVYNENERWMMDRATREGHVDETAASQLAGWANANTLQRASMNQGRRIIDTIMRVGMQPLQIIEQYTRRVSMLSHFDSYIQAGMSRERAYNAALQDMHLSLGDNSILSRAEILRGKKSVVLLYYNYTRRMSYLMAGGWATARRGAEARGELPAAKGLGNETMRMWFAYAMLGGLMGLPGADDLDRIIELVAKQMGYRASLKEEAYALAKDVVDNAPDLGLGLSPRSIVHGLTSAIPLPGGGAIDVSSSVSLGSALPGLQGVDKLGGRDTEKFLIGLLGPLGKRVEETMHLFDDNLPWEKRYAIALPTAVQNIIKAAQDDPRFWSGGRVTVDPKTGQVKDLTTGENLMQAFGFSPADVQARQELHYMQKDFADYWMNRRSGLMMQVWEARLQKSQDALHDAMQAVRRYNESVPASGLRITGDNLTTSYAHRLQSAQRDERGQPQVTGLRPGYREIQDSVLGR